MFEEVELLEQELQRELLKNDRRSLSMLIMQLRMFLGEHCYPHLKGAKTLEALAEDSSGWEAEHDRLVAEPHRQGFADFGAQVAQRFRQDVDPAKHDKETPELFCWTVSELEYWLVRLHDNNFDEVVREQVNR